MTTARSERCAAQLTDWLKRSTSLEPVATTARQVGFSIPAVFGRRKRMALIQGELMIAHSALAIFAVNSLCEGTAAREFIDAFLERAGAEVFRPQEAADPSFRSRYEKHIARYFEEFSRGGKLRLLMMGVASRFLDHLGLGILHHVREGRMREFDPLAEADHVVKLVETLEYTLQTVVASIKPHVTGATPPPRVPPDEAPGSTGAEAGGERSFEKGGGLANLNEPSRLGFLGMMDIDNFDLLNEKVGRPAGDQVMRAYVRLTASKARTDTILTETGLCALLDEAQRRPTDLGYVLCRPYSSGDEFIIFHQNLEAVRALVEGVAQEASRLEIPLSDEAGKAVAVLHGIPVSIGCGTSRREAWAQVMAQKKGNTRRGMEARLEMRSDVGEPTPSTAGIEDAMKTYMEVLKDEGTSARPSDFVTTLRYLEPSSDHPPDWPGVPLCGCCAAPFALVARRDGLWVAKGLRDSRPVPICAACISHLNELPDEQRGRPRFALPATYDVVGQQLVGQFGAGDVRKLAVTRIMLLRSRMKEH